MDFYNVYYIKDFPGENTLTPLWLGGPYPQDSRQPPLLKNISQLLFYYYYSNYDSHNKAHWSVNYKWHFVVSLFL